MSHRISLLRGVEDEAAIYESREDVVLSIHRTPLSSSRAGIARVDCHCDSELCVAGSNLRIQENVFITSLQEFRDCHVVYVVDTPRNDDPRNNASSQRQRKSGWTECLHIFLYSSDNSEIAAHSLAKTTFALSFKILSTTVLMAFFLIFLFATLVNNIYAAQKILATSAPIASLVSMVSGDDIEISVFRNSTGCMHHFHLKPQDVELLKSQDLIIYSSDKLESFLAKVPVKEKLWLVDSNANMHFWLDIKTTKEALEKISTKIRRLPNLQNILQRMDMLELELKKTISQHKERTFITLSKELDDLFKCLGIEYIYKNPSNMAETQEIIDLAKRDNYHLIITQHYLSHKLEKFVDQSKIINIETENWNFDSNKELPELYFKEMKKIIERLYG